LGEELRKETAMARMKTRSIRFSDADLARMDRLVRAIVEQRRRDPGLPASLPAVSYSSALKDLLKAWDEGSELPKRMNRRAA
jgi:hypothetical protein